MNYVFALWIVIISASILGRLIDKSSSQTILLEENPEITLEQAREWQNEFFSRRSSRTVPYSRFTDHFPESSPTSFATSNVNTHRLNRGHDENIPQHNGYGPRPHIRTNSRDYNLTSVRVTNEFRQDYEQRLQQPRIKAENLEWMLKNIFTYPRSHATNETAKEIVLKYIRDSLQITSGLHTTVQQFEPVQFLSMYEGSSVPTGTNIIGIIKGTEWSTGRDRPIVIGAHWDTVNFTPGTDDNGSGVAAMLETARTIAHADCKPKYSIIFAAFDLEEVGSQGSLAFIKDYLAQVLNVNFPKELNYATKFQGAFIMDTIMDFNATESSQTFPTDWSLVIPDVYEEVANENYVGDFLSMIYRRGIDYKLADRFHYHWSNSLHESKFRLKPFPLHLSEELPDLQVLSDHLNFLRSDHARFWYMNDTDVPHTLNAVLMTDTGPYRGNMRSCYHTFCDGPEVSIYENPTNMKFLEKITQVLTDTVLDMSQCGSYHVPHHSSSMSNNYLLKRNGYPGSKSSSSGRKLTPSILQDMNNIVKLIQQYS